MRFLLLSVLCAFFALTTASDVLDLTTEDFDATVSQYDTMLIEFFAPWCGHCKRLAPEYEVAATKLKNNDPTIPLAKVDCTNENGGKDICQKFGVQGYPTLKIFKNGEFSSEYNGPRQADGIVKYMKSKVGPSSRLYESKADLDKALEKASDVIVLGLFEKDGASDMQTSFLKAADKLRESVSFAHLFVGKVEDVYKISRLAKLDEKIRVNSNNVLVIRPKVSINKFEDNIVAYSGDGDLVQFINKNYHGLVGHRTQDNSPDFKDPLVIVYYDVDYVKNPKGTNYWRNRVLKVAQNHKNTHFAISNSNQFAGEIGEFGLEASRERDATPVVAARSAAGLKYKMQDKFSVETLEKFVSDFEAGSLVEYVKSEDEPADNDSASVKVAVAKNIKDLVINSDKDTLIEFYAPWCGHCKNLAPTYEELGAKLKNEPNVQIVKMDATANDVPPEFEVQGFPTLYWYPKNKVIKRYDSGRDLDSFVNFIAKHSTEELLGFDRAGKPKGSKTEL